MNNSQRDANLTGNIRKRDDGAEPNNLLVDEEEVNNTAEIRKKRCSINRDNTRGEVDDHFLLSSSSPNNNNELTTSCILRSPLSNKTNNTTNTYASLKRDDRDDTTEEFHDDDAIECNDNNGDDSLLDCDDRIATQQQSTLGNDGNGEISTPGNNTPYMASDTSLLRMGMNAFDTVRKTLDYTVLGQRLWGSRNSNEEEKENDNILFNGGGGDVDMDDDNTSSPPTTTTCSGGNCGSCCGGVCSEETSNPINYDIPHQATDDDIQECRQILIPKKILHIIRDVDGFKQDIETDEEGAKLTSGLLADILDESRHKDLRLIQSSDESKEEEEEKLEEEENGDGDTSTTAAPLPPTVSEVINGVDVSSFANKQEVTLVCNASNILVFGCKINGGGKHPSPKAYKLVLGILNELYDKEETHYKDWKGHGDRVNGFNYGTNGAVKFFDNLVRLAKKEHGMEFARWIKNKDGSISLKSFVLDENAEGLDRYEDAASRKKSHSHAKNQSDKTVLRKLLFIMLQDIDERNERQERWDTREEEKQSETEMEKEAIAEAPSANKDEDFMSSDFVPSHDDEYVPTDPHVTSSSEESEQMELEKEDAKEAMEERKKEEEEEEEENQIAVAEEGAVSTQSESGNKHKTILSVILTFRLFFELCLLMSNMQSRPEYNVIAMLVVQLLDLSMEQLVVQKNESYRNRWKNGDWKTMLGEIVFNAMRILCLQCCNCHRTTSGIDPAMLFGWHLDHLLAHWLKVKRCSAYPTTGNINRLIFEALKTCLMCVFCHENGRIPNFAALLNEAMNPSMTYPLGMFGEDRRTGREVLQLKEFRSFVLDLKGVDAFGHTTDIPCSWEYIKLSAWHHFHLCLETLTHYRENNWIEWGPKNRHQIAVRIVANIIKILSVKCPNPDCDEYFIKIAGIMLSGVQINHRGLKSIQFSDAVIKGIDSFMDECVKGNGDCTCGMHHGIINNAQNNSESEHAKLEWVIPSLNVRRVRS